MRHGLGHPVACALLKWHLKRDADRRGVACLQLLLLVRKWRGLSTISRCVPATRSLSARFVRDEEVALPLSAWTVRNTLARADWLSSLSLERAVEEFPYGLFVAAESEVWRVLEEQHWGAFARSCA